MTIDSTSIPQLITAIGALGTAAFGLVDASKAAFGSFNHVGFGGIRKTVLTLLPKSDPPRNDAIGNVQSIVALPTERFIGTVRANWFNGVDLATQKAIAKSLIKLNLSPGNADKLATATGVPSLLLASVATKTVTGDSLTAQESDILGRFDLIVAAMLDEAYQNGDQEFRNWTRAAAMVVAVLLAVAAELILGDNTGHDIGEAVFVGLLATPIAPIAKDLSSALATAVNTMQLVKKK